MEIDKALKKQRMDEAWKRFFARFIDVFFFSLIFGFILGLLIVRFSLDFSLDELGNFSSVPILFFWVFVETLLLSTWGTTPGKFLFNITLKNAQGKKPDMVAAYKRSFLVYICGMMAGLPGISLMTMAYGLIAVINKGSTFWDRQGQFELTFRKISNTRMTIIVLLIVLIFAISIYGVIGEKS